MAEVDVKAWSERKKRGEAVRDFLKSAVYSEIVLPFLEGTKAESIKAAYTQYGDPNKLIACVAFAQAYQSMQDALETTAKDAEIDLANLPEAEEGGPDITQ